MNLYKLKAIVYTKYGGPEVLQIKEMEKPYPNDDEVLIKVHAVSINDWDWGLLQGDFINRPSRIGLEVKGEPGKVERVCVSGTSVVVARGVLEF